MPDFETSENMFFSFDVGPIHFVSLDTEAYYYPEYGYEITQTQYDWLVQVRGKQHALVTIR